MIKANLRAKVNKSTGATAYELFFPFTDGREVVAQVFPLMGQLRYRYVVREAPDANGKREEKEYFSDCTIGKVTELWEQQNPEERGPKPQNFNESDLAPFLVAVSRARHAFLAPLWLPIPGQELQLIEPPKVEEFKNDPAEVGLGGYDPSQFEDEE